jgi:hypothetical protein
VKHQLTVLKKLDALCESFSLKSFPLLCYDPKFAGFKEREREREFFLIGLFTTCSITE